MATKFTITVNAGDIPAPVVSGARQLSANRLASLFKKVASGSGSAVTAFYARNAAVNASGTFTLEDEVATGTLTAIINGVSVAVTYATSITHSAGLMAAAINASVNALVAGHVTATSDAGVVTVTAVQPGIAGNTITTTATGTGFTAEQARLAGGTETLVSFTSL